MSLTELLLQAKAKKAEDFLFVVGSDPRIRTTSGWSILRSSPALISEWGILQQSLLSDSQRAVLDSSGIVRGETSIDCFRIGFSFYQDRSTMKAHLEMDLDGQSQEVQLPPSLMESALRPHGLMLMAGTGSSGQAWSLHRLLQKLGEERSGLGMIFSQTLFPQLQEEKMCYLYHNGTFVSHEEETQLLAGVSLVVYSGFDDEDSFKKALSMAERGYFVIYSMKAPSIMNALRRALSALQSSRHGAGRLAEVLSVVVGHYGVPSLTAERVYAYEVLPMKPQVRNLVQEQDLKGIEDLLSQAVENSGLLNLNQSLLQHLIRRKIDIKTAFAVARDPESLDLLLKKVGI